MEHQADQGHAGILMRDMGIDEGSKGGVKPLSEYQRRGHAREGQARGESLFRAVAARASYFGQDRVDVQFAAKEIWSFTSKPDKKDWRSAKRLTRYLKICRRVLIEPKTQKLPDKVVVWSDTDFWGCKRTRGST